jgi:hypothetical protein
MVAFGPKVVWVDRRCDFLEGCWNGEHPHFVSQSCVSRSSFDATAKIERKWTKLKENRENFSSMTGTHFLPPISTPMPG